MNRSHTVLLAILVGMMGGFMIKDIVVMAHAQGGSGSTFEYRILDMREVEKELSASADFQQRLKETMNRFGSQGWRYAGPGLQFRGNTELVVFERSREAATPPSVRELRPLPAPAVTPPPVSK